MINIDKEFKMNIIGKAFPEVPRKTAVHDVEEWYQNHLTERLNRPYQSIQRSNFGQYDMAVHYLTSVLEEAKAIEKVALFNIDHMAQIQFEGKDACALLHRVLPANVENMTDGQCKYTLLLNEDGSVRDDLIIMKFNDEKYIIVINAGHDLTGKGMDHGHEVECLSDADFILKYKKENEIVHVKDVSDDFVKIDIQGPLSMKIIRELFGDQALKNRKNPDKWMGFFSFNECIIENQTFYFSRTGYTNRWGWEVYIPTCLSQKYFKLMIEKVLENDGLLVGLGGRDENRLSAGNVGLPLMGQEYDGKHTPTNAPLFNAAIDMTKDSFVGKSALVNDVQNKCNKKMVLIISEGNAVDKAVYLDGKRIGSVTSSIVSPNVSQEKREFIGSTRKNVLGENGTAAIGLAWLYQNPFDQDAEGNDIIVKSDQPVRIKVELYKEVEGQISGKPLLAYISADGVSPATAPKALKAIENL
jgi:glycine cleavage system aminomethyltransferase T